MLTLELALSLDLTISYRVILKALWISPEYWLHGDWFLLHFWESRFLKGSGVCVLIYPTKIPWVSTVCQVGWTVMRMQRCALEEIRVEWVPNFPLKRLYIPEDMTKDIYLGENRAQKMGFKKLLDDVYSSAREFMYQFTGKCQMEASHSSAWKYPLTQLIERILDARDIIR